MPDRYRFGRMRRGNRFLVRLLLAVCAALAVLATASSALASPAIKYGVEDDAWLRFGPGTLDDRVARLESLGVQVMRINVMWNQVEPRRGVYDWSGYDPAIDALHAAGIEPVLTLVSAPSWANGGLGTNWVPLSGSTFAAFAAAAAEHYPFVTRWLIWNEPNQRRWLRPTLPSLYVQRLLNPAYAAIHRVLPHALVGGGVTAPRAATGGVSPVTWIQGMAAAHAKLDAYAHNPYPSSPAETPMSGGCTHCTTLTMATLPRLIADVKQAFGPTTRIWLSEYGYQTNPPDPYLGVSYAKQAAYIGEAALRAYLAQRVDLLIQYLIQDQPDVAAWQSGLLTVAGKEKPSYQAFQVPLAVKSRTQTTLTLWGQIRPGTGRQAYELQILRGSRWLVLGASGETSPHGYFTRVVPAIPGAHYRVVQLTRGLTSASVAVSG